MNVDCSQRAVYGRLYENDERTKPKWNIPNVPTAHRNETPCVQNGQPSFRAVSAHRTAQAIGCAVCRASERERASEYKNARV